MGYEILDSPTNFSAGYKSHVYTIQLAVQPAAWCIRSLTLHNALVRIL